MQDQSGEEYEDDEEHMDHEEYEHEEEEEDGHYEEDSGARGHDHFDEGGHEHSQFDKSMLKKSYTQQVKSQNIIFFKRKGKKKYLLFKHKTYYLYFSPHFFSKNQSEDYDVDDDMELVRKARRMLLETINAERRMYSFKEKINK